MKLNQLSIPKGSRHKIKRVGRGHSSGWGKTSGRGHKGQKARSGASIPAWFEGGQMPLIRRIPKRGFTNPFRKQYAIINIKELATLPADEIITPETLYRHGLVKGAFDGIKILGDGELELPLHIKAHKFSKTAADKIRAAGGKAEEI
ncbi:50S ribosomal protein L15 [bacterium]|nr:50S ribosomal protein L15 [candidate division CSSED10-310 bacterium]